MQFPTNYSGVDTNNFTQAVTTFPTLHAEKEDIENVAMGTRLGYTNAYDH